jgi:hypothetical protein
LTPSQFNFLPAPAEFHPPLRLTLLTVVSNRERRDRTVPGYAMV